MFPTEDALARELQSQEDWSLRRRKRCSRPTGMGSRSSEFSTALSTALDAGSNERNWNSPRPPSSSSSAPSSAKTSARPRARCSISGWPSCGWSRRATAGPTRRPGLPPAGADKRARARAACIASVAAAVADCAHVYATTVRKRGVTKPVVTPRQAAERSSAAGAVGDPVRAGALGAGDRRCRAGARTIVTVPINPEFGLAQSRPGGDPVSPMNGRKARRSRSPPPSKTRSARPSGRAGRDDRTTRRHAGVERDFFRPPDRAPVTRRTLRTMLTKPGWSHWRCARCAES